MTLLRAYLSPLCTGETSHLAIEGPVVPPLQESACPVSLGEVDSHKQRPPSSVIPRGGVLVNSLEQAERFLCGEAVSGSEEAHSSAGPLRSARLPEPGAWEASAVLTPPWQETQN